MGTKQGKKYEALRQGGYTKNWFLIFWSDSELAQTSGAMDLDTAKKLARKDSGTSYIEGPGPEPPEPEYNNEAKKRKPDKKPNIDL